ncbi:MAG: error-prone DNA polymerase [Anaerolineae bacterium]|nr:error-prone DNA polymerase [Anaerolineae bacterium]
MFVHLHTHSYFSLLDGVSSPEVLVRQAAHLNMPALALTDHNAIYGVMAFVAAARAHGIKPIVGAEMTLEDESHLTLLVETAEGWSNLCSLITIARANAPKGEAALPERALESHAAGLIALSGCRQGSIAQAILADRLREARDIAARYRDWFGRDNFVIELQHHLLPQDARLNARLVAIAQALDLTYVATNNVHYACRDEHELQDVVVCIRTHTTLDTSHHVRRPNSEYYLKSQAEMATLFKHYPEAITTTERLAERCHFTPAFGVQDLPESATSGGQSAISHLKARCEAVLSSRRLDRRDEMRALLDHELVVIEHARLANYFLLVADVVDFARSQGIRCQGRGSAANSLVAHLLGISPVDPLTHNLVFERFLSEERVSVPDIDIDFDAARREEVIQYVYEKYGRDHAAMACTFVTYRRRSSVREVGKALGLSPHLVDDALLAIELDRPLPAASPYARELLRLSEALKGHPRHLGIHNGGMVITGAPLALRLPTEPATMEGRTVVQWDKEALEEAGIVKIDILGLRMLSAIDEAVRIVEATTGQQLDLDRLPTDDPALYKMLERADTIGVFQVESRAQAQTLPRLKPKTFNDVIVSISLIRPGPVQGNMVHPYLRRRRGAEPVIYPHPRLEAALEETLGVILFQEQVLKVARDLAGFTPGQGELLRRALGAKRAPEAIERLREEFVAGAQQQDVLEHVAQAVFDSLTAFGGYSFPKSHAAAFAVLVYQSAYLKHYHPAAFLTAILNHQPMGFWTPAVVANDARRHGIPVLGVDVNKSATRCTVEGSSIRLGFAYIQGIGDNLGQRIETARQGGAFCNLADLVRRTHIPPRLLTRLIVVGACDSWERNRRKLLWEARRLIGGNTLGLRFDDEQLDLKPLTPLEEFTLEARYVGIATGPHLMTHYRQWMKSRGICGSRELNRLRSGTRVDVAGETVMHQAPPTAKGFHFITLEDSAGMMNVIVRPRVYKRYKDVLRCAPVLWISGIVERDEGVINILCDRASPVPNV